MVPDEFFYELSKHKWSAFKCGHTTYARRNAPKIKGERHKVILMHRVILNAPKGIKVDHKDGNGLNNLLDNIRLAPKGANEMNRTILKSNKSGYKGVHWCNFTGRWRVQIWCDNKKYEIGRFDKDCILDAARAYNEAAIRLHGEFASLNEILEDLMCCC